MKLLKIQYNLGDKDYIYIPLDGKDYTIGHGLIIRGFENNDKYKIVSTSFERIDPNNQLSELQYYSNEYEVNINQSFLGSYSTLEWSYLKGNYYSTDDFRAIVINAKDEIELIGDDVLKAKIYLYDGEYQKANLLLDPLLINDDTNTNYNAYKLKGEIYEKGLGVEQDLEKAYIHYLYSESREDIQRFLKMGYSNISTEDIDKIYKIDKCEIYQLLYEVGKKDYAYKKIIYYAGMWIYKDSEKESKKEDYLKERELLAKCRKLACQWIMERNDYKYIENNKFKLFLGAYCSYLIQGHEGMCTYEVDNGGGSMGYGTNISAAERYIEKLANENEFVTECINYLEKASKEIIKQKWSPYVLKLRRDDEEYRYGSWYNHYWNEVYEIEENLDKTSRGERIKINSIVGETINFTFYDEKTPPQGIESSISLSNPSVTVRSSSNSGGNNEFAWSYSDYVKIKIINKDDIDK